MSFLGKLFGKKKSEEAEASNSEDLIRFTDRSGREFTITRDKWKHDVLRPNLKEAWDKPEELYGWILAGMNEGFRPEILKAAEHLYHTDPVPSSGTCLWGVILVEEGRLDEAEKIYTDFLSKHGEDAVVLLNLAKVHARRNDEEKTLEILWRALETYPNHDNSVGLYEAIFREKSGVAAGVEALQRIAALPGSWRAQSILAKMALDAGNLSEAMAKYESVLSALTRPVPGDFLVKAGEDLTQAGYRAELLLLLVPAYDAQSHSIEVANLILRARIELGQIDEAQQMISELAGHQREEWKPYLDFWTDEITKLTSPQPVASMEAQTPQELKICMITLKGPVWLRENSQAFELFPAKKDPSPRVCFLGSSAEVGSQEGRVASDAPALLSRIVPLFLSEQVHWRTSAVGQTIIPRLISEPGGFVLYDVPMAGDVACNAATNAEPSGDYVVTIHLLAQAEPWTAELQVYRAKDQTHLGSLKGNFSSTEPESGLRQLADSVVELLQKNSEVVASEAPSSYQLPEGPQFGYYLLRLEQALAVSFATMANVLPGILTGEHEIMSGNIQLCINHPQNPTTRLLLAQTVKHMAKAKPEVVAQFRDQIAQLQREHPLVGPLHGAVQKMFMDVFA